MQLKLLVRHIPRTDKSAPYQLKSEIMCYQKTEGPLKHLLNLGKDDYLFKVCSTFIVSYKTVLHSEKCICKTKLKLSFVLITLQA